MAINYETLKAIAARNKIKVDTLVALSPKNDAFYMGTPGDVVLGEWFAGIWNKFGYGGGVHVRRVHYQLISNPSIKLPNGDAYENTDRCWGILTQASKVARYLELVNAGDFVDRRNPEAVDYSSDPEGEPEIGVYNSLWGEMPSLPAFPSPPDYSVSNYDPVQRYHLEIWAEKSTMNDVLLPICRSFGAVLQTGLGELSITAALNAVERIAQRGKPARIFYVSDFDPAGLSMPVAVSRKIEFFLYSKGYDVDIRLMPVILTQEQVKKYKLPRTPIKESERRAGAFEERFGSGAVELDALEALRPGELRRVLHQAMSEYYDFSLGDMVASELERLSGDLETKRQDVTEPFQEELDRMEREYNEIRALFTERISVINTRLQEVYKDIEAQMEEEQPDIEDYPLPEADEADEGDDALYDSSRDYMDQLEFYKEFQGKS